MGGGGKADNFFDKIVKLGGFFEKIFGKEMLTDLVYDNEYEKSKRMLSEVYGYTGINDIFGKKINRDEFKKTLKILFKYTENGSYNTK